MICSMTGFGSAERVADGVSYVFEIRSVNHRYLKLSIRLPDRWQFCESVIEKAIRSRVSRGSISCALRIRTGDEVGACPINHAVLQSYADQLTKTKVPDGVSASIDLAALAALPGVFEQPDFDDDARKRQAAFVRGLAEEAGECLARMRSEEGKALETALRDLCESLRAHLDTVLERAPLVVDEYHTRLKNRVAVMMQNGGHELQEDALAREVAIYAERSDIAEEITRLKSHLDQFEELCAGKDPVGRTLDFLTQELLREANTIASKSGDAVVARTVVEMKGQIDRLKEQVQNVE